MFHKVRERLGTAGLVVAVLALIVALSGGAFAATQSAKKKSSKYMTKSQVLALIKANATSGPPGAPGPSALLGRPAQRATRGHPEAAGLRRANGKSVKLTTIAPLTPKCSERGGVTAEVEELPATAKDICNGATGAPGAPGSPWAPDNELPEGATETGAGLQRQ